MDRDSRGRRIVYPPIIPFIDEWGDRAFRVELTHQTVFISVDPAGDPLPLEEALEMVKELLRDGLAQNEYLPSDFYPPDAQSMNMWVPYAAEGGHTLEEEAYWDHYSGGIPASAEAISGLLETSVKEGESAAQAVAGLLKKTSVKEDDCSVCLMNFDTSNKIRVMPCSHYFHEQCIFTWLRLNHVCPLCRFPLPAQEQQ